MKCTGLQGQKQSNSESFTEDIKMHMVKTQNDSGAPNRIVQLKCPWTKWFIEYLKNMNIELNMEQCDKRSVSKSTFIDSSTFSNFHILELAFQTARSKGAKSFYPCPAEQSKS